MVKRYLNSVRDNIWVEASTNIKNEVWDKILKNIRRKVVINIAINIKFPIYEELKRKND